ncbi:MAG: hypothetical protein ACE5HO_14350 [bacterium]
MFKLEGLPRNRLLQVLDFIEFLTLKTKSKHTKTKEATDNEILSAIENSGSLEFYYDDSQDVYTMEDGEPV